LRDASPRSRTPERKGVILGEDARGGSVVATGIDQRSAIEAICVAASACSTPAPARKAILTCPPSLSRAATA
jgi:hypothetical protein